MNQIPFEKQKEEILSEFNFNAVIDHKEKLGLDEPTCAELRKLLGGLIDRLMEFDELAGYVRTGGFTVRWNYDWDGQNPSIEAVYAPEVTGYLARPYQEPK